MKLSRDIGIDLGTANILVYEEGKGIVLREPSVVAVDKNTGKVLQVGAAARNMLGRTPGNIVAVRPLRDGVISDYEMTEKMLDQFLKKISKFSLIKPRVIVCVPSGVTEVEERAVIQATMEAGARRVYLIEEPYAAALGAKLDITGPDGHMVVDIGGGTTDIAVLSLGGIATSSSIKIAGDTFDEAVAAFMRKRYGMIIGLNTAEEVKITIGCVYDRPEPVSMLVKGRDLKTGLPKEEMVSSVDLMEAFKRPARQIVDEVLDVLEHSSPELVADIAQNGIVLTGGSAKLKDLDELFRRVTGMEVRIGTAEEAVDETSREKVASPAYSTAVGLLLRGAAHGDCAVTDIPRQGGAAQSAGPTIPRATPYSAGKPATGVSAAPYTPRPAAAPTPPPTTPAANAATEGAAQGAAAETVETPHRPKRGLLDKLKQKLGTRLDDFFTGSEDEEI